MNHKTQLHCAALLLTLLFFTGIFCLNINAYAADDTSGPTIGILQISPEAVSAGNTVTLSVSINDKSGVTDGVSVKFYSDMVCTGEAALKRTGGDQYIGKYTGSFKIPSGYSAGKWYGVVYAYDNCGNFGGSERSYFTVNGTVDNNGPAVSSISLTPDAVSAGEKVTITAKLKDDCGISGDVVVRFLADTVYAGETVMKLSKGSETNGTYKGTFKIPSGYSAGTWSAVIFAYDKYKNPCTFNETYFTVNGPVDSDGPEVSNVSITPTSVLSGEEITISAELTDASGVAEGVTMCFYVDSVYAGETALQLVSGDAYDAVYTGTFTVPSGYSAGTWFGQIFANDTLGNMCALSQTEFTVSNKKVSFARISGETRYETAVQTAEKLRKTLGLEKFDSVLVASGVNFPDALAGSPLAAMKNAPVLLVGSNDKNEKQAAGTAVTVKYIKKKLNAGGTVYILGGTSVVSSATENKLKKAGFNTVRLEGTDRYATNLAIINEMKVKTGTDVVIVRGYTSYKSAADQKANRNPQGYADSISVSAVAAAKGMPIFLCGQNGLTADQLKKLKKINPSNIYIIGGTGAVSSAAESAVKGAVSGKVIRIAGSTRYETAVKIAEQFGLSQSVNACVAYGLNFPDGLTGGVLAAKLGAPMLLTESGKSGIVNDFILNGAAEKLYVFGGTSVLSDEDIYDMTH